MNSNTETLHRALQSLPHGPEFRFVDRLTSLEPGQRGTGEYRVKGDEYFLRGHFPGNPIFPGMLLIEAAAQLAGTIGQSDPAIAAMDGLKLTAVRNAKILGAVRPGETILLQAEITGRLVNLFQASARAFVGEKLILQVELTLSGEKREGSK